jgi:hypothetical protein
MVVILGFIRNPQAVLLLAACPTPKSDRLLAGVVSRNRGPNWWRTVLRTVMSRAIVQ